LTSNKIIWLILHKLEFAPVFIILGNCLRITIRFQWSNRHYVVQVVSDNIAERTGGLISAM